MTFGRGAGWRLVAVWFALSLPGHAVTVAAELARIGDRPAPVLEQRRAKAAVLVVLPPNTPVQVLDREDDWCWIVAEGEATGGIVRVGWVRKEALARIAPQSAVRPPAMSQPTPGGFGAAPVAATAASRIETVATERIERHVIPPVGGPSPEPIDRLTAPPPSLSPLVAAAEAAKRTSDARPPRPTGSGSAGSTGSAAAPPPPAGSSANRGTSLGSWIQPLGLRASVGFGYQSASVSQASGRLDDRRIGGLATVAATFAVLDPKILAVDFSGDFQMGRTTSHAPSNAFSDKTGLNSYRLEVGVLTGRSAPLRIYADRVSTTTGFQPMGESADALRRTRGVRTTSGFTWDVNAPKVPRIQLSASTGLQRDDRDYLFGYSSTNSEQRAELRVTGDRPKAKFDLDITHGDFLYDVPAAGMRSRTGSDLLVAGGRFAPTGRLSIDVHGRASRFQLGNGFSASSVTGIGGDAAVRYQFTTNVAAVGRYSRSTNVFEAVLSGQVDPRETGSTALVPSGALAGPTEFSDGEVRLERSTRRLTTAAIFKTVSYGVPGFLPPTLSALTTAGGLVRAERTVKGFTLAAGFEGSAGTALSNQQMREPYREIGVQAGIARDAGSVIRFGLDASVRRTGRLDFYPVNLEARFVTARLETTRPGWAVVHASVTRFHAVRDIVYVDTQDQHTSFTVGVGSRWYEATADIGQSETNPLLLSPYVVSGRPEVVLLLASRPEMLRNLIVSTDRSRSFGLQVRPVSGLLVQGRVRRLEQAYPGLLGYSIRGAQVWATYQVREVQLEFGLESFDSRTTFGNVHDQRIYFKVRRDLLFMR